MDKKSEQSGMFPLKINIKQEKTTSHDRQDSSKSETVDKLSIDFNISSIFQTSDKKSDVKSVEPLKSSNEILTELFKVFNAAPPEILLNDDDSNDAKSQHKKKKKKHKKKSKRKHKEHEIDCTSSSGSEDEGKSKKKVKKEKSKKKREKKKRKSDTITVKTEKSESPLREEKTERHKEESVKNDGEKTKSHKIKIKNLKDSTIFQKDPAKSKEKSSSKKRKVEDLDDFSLSEEEVYPPEKSDLYSSKYSFYDRDFYGSYHPEEEHSRKRRRSDSWRDRHEHHNSRSRSPPQFDKKKLLEIARKNAINMLKNGTLPGVQNLGQEAKDKIISKMKHGGKSIDELTDYCKKLSNFDNLNELSSVSSEIESDQDGDGTKAFNHPFQIKDRGPIVMNIKNSIPLPPKSAEQTKALLMQFPVSSGQQHRTTESEWVPVQPTPPPPTPKLAKPEKPEKIVEPKPAFTPVIPVEPKVVKEPPVKSIEVFPTNVQASGLDVSTIISQRLNAMRKLQDNPTDAEAIKLLYNTQKDMSAWANSKFTPGQFLGTTGVNVLTAKELASGYQPWVKKDMLISSQPVSGGMGMHLLQKMGWVPGEGLGKEKNGSLQPLLLEIKLDKRGLVANEEEAQHQQQQQQQQRVKRPGKIKINLEGKHPVSVLGEYSCKRKWKPPRYEMVHESGPGHAKNFIFKVIMNGLEYQPAISSNTKKDAKATAAKFCLQQIGVVASA